MLDNCVGLWQNIKPLYKQRLSNQKMKVVSNIAKGLTVFVDLSSEREPNIVYNKI